MITLCLLGGVGLGIFALVRWVLHFFHEIRKEVAAALVIGSGTVTAAIMAQILSRKFEREKNYQRSQQESRRTPYEEFVKGLGPMFGMEGPEAAEKSCENPSNQAAVFGKFAEMVIVWGSADLLHAFSRLRRLAIDPELIAKDEYAALYALEHLFLAMRTDLGHKDKKLKEGDILRLFITDYDEMVSRKPKG